MKTKLHMGRRLLAMITVLVFVATTILTGTVSFADTQSSLTNGTFETGDLSGWTNNSTATLIVKTDSYASNTTKIGNIWAESASSVDLSQTVTLAAGSYVLSFDCEGAASSTAEQQLTLSAAAGATTLAQVAFVSTGWNVWTTQTAEAFTLTETTAVTVTLSGTVNAGYWGDFDNIALTKQVTRPEISINVVKVTDLAEDFIMGVDISSLASEEAAGVQYYDFDGNESDALTVLANSGANYVRIRVWNDPFDTDGNGYGGGNCNLTQAVALGTRATNLGMKVLIDFHYSDFWADPGKQKAPKAWSGYTVTQTAQAVADFTTASLNTLKTAGVNVTMVQIGNETNSGIAGVTGNANMCTVFKAAAAAVRAVDSSILIACHFTNPQNSTPYYWAQTLSNNSVDYDVLATSYYMFWHGTTSNLTTMLQNVVNDFGKKVMVAETSYCYTAADGDGHENSVLASAKVDGYDFTVQGQANALRDVIAATAAVGSNALGVFYWEPAWIPVNVYDANASDAASVLAANKLAWQTYGCGWASSYAGDYSSDAVTYYGGSSWDNQALFDFTGHPLDSMEVFNRVYDGNLIDDAVTDVENPTVTIEQGGTLTLPETVTLTYLSGTTQEAAVTWNAAELAAINVAVAGSYTVSGALEDGTAVTCTVVILYPNVLSNPSFELSDMSMYTIAGSGSTGVARTTDDPLTGSCSLHFWNNSGLNFTVEQTVTLAAGKYSFTPNIQGGDMGDSQSITSYVTIGGVTTSSDSVTLSGWKVWQTPAISFTLTEETTVTVGMAVVGAAGGWGTIDDWTLRMTYPLLRGDVNCDGSITSSDVATLISYVLGESVLSEQAIQNALLTDDDQISSADAALLQLYLLGQIEAL